jgi:hypothetical protein
LLNENPSLLTGEISTPDTQSKLACVGRGREIRNREREDDLMNTTNKSKGRSSALLLSILGAGVVAFLGGCAEGPYVTSYDTGYYPAAYYTPNTYYRTYSYYEPAYDTTVVRSGTRYYDAYGPRYGGSMYGSDWY